MLFTGMSLEYDSIIESLCVHLLWLHYYVFVAYKMDNFVRILRLFFSFLLVLFLLLF